MKPFLKWAGGKRTLAPKIASLMPAKVSTYCEPFLGGGAVFFHLRSIGWEPTHDFYLSDVSADLIRTWVSIRPAHCFLMEIVPLLESLVEDHKRDAPGTYKRIREAFNLRRYGLEAGNRARRLGYASTARCDLIVEPDALAAAWFLYLNQTCFNGLWRVNRKGEFNVPIGKYVDPPIYDLDKLEAARKAMRWRLDRGGCGVRIQQLDYRLALSRLGTGDFAYLDPPYLPVSSTSNFAAYADSFSEENHRELAKECWELRRRGVAFVLSNSDVPLARELYEGFEIQSVQARRSINSKGGKRGAVGEVLVVSR